MIRSCYFLPEDNEQRLKIGNLLEPIGLQTCKKENWGVNIHIKESLISQPWVVQIFKTLPK